MPLVDQTPFGTVGQVNEILVLDGQLMMWGRKPLATPLHIFAHQAGDGLRHTDKVGQVDGERITDVGGGWMQRADVADVQDAANSCAVQGATGPATGGVQTTNDVFANRRVEEQGFGRGMGGAGLGEPKVPAGRAVHDLI
ncbi:hypothetical protein CBQ26_19770 [Deinococcus indicus]|uniref:Uncharacterized protein n=1 Tax=Deinococcus indicus TaxID=223556 RepID=A0A246BE57_9DEIO|nr:hypothetical protein CBQ26_19770 [Deinococcus indicus]